MGGVVRGAIAPVRSVQPGSHPGAAWHRVRVPRQAADGAVLHLRLPAQRQADGSESLTRVGQADQESQSRSVGVPRETRRMSNAPIDGEGIDVVGRSDVEVSRLVQGDGSLHVAKCAPDVSMRCGRCDQQAGVLTAPGPHGHLFQPPGTCDAAGREKQQQYEHAGDLGPHFSIVDLRRLAGQGYGKKRLTTRTR